MAYTAIADLIKHDAFAQYFTQAMLERSTLFKSGIATADPTIARKCAEAGFGGEFVSLPFFNSLDVSDGHAEQTLAEGTDLVPDKVTASKDRAVIIRRGKAFGANDLAADVAGADPMRVVAEQFADWWNARNQKRLMSVLAGVFARNVASDDSSLVLDISGEEGEAAILSKDTIMLAAQLLGDRKLDLTAVAMHSMVETFLASMDTNAGLYRASDAAATLPKYNGRDVIVDDNCGYNPSTKVVELYLFGRGAVAYNPCPVKVPFEADRNPLINGGQDYVVSRTANICHLRGYKWNSASANPDNSALATGSNWAKVYDVKDIRCVKLIAKIG